MPLLVLDLGGAFVRAAYSPTLSLDAPTTTGNGRVPTKRHPSPEWRRTSIPNCVGILRGGIAAAGVPAVAVGAQLSSLPHYHGLLVRRPFERGFLADTALQRAIVDDVLRVLSVGDCAATDVIVTVAVGCPLGCDAAYWTLLHATFSFRQVCYLSPTFLALMALLLFSSGSGSSAAVGPHHQSDVIVVDSGFSHTLVRRYALSSAGAGQAADPLATKVTPDDRRTFRIDVGGKLLTNRLKEVLSFSQFNLVDDTWLVNEIKERTAVVASSFAAALRAEPPVRPARVGDGSDSSGSESDDSSGSGGIPSPQRLKRAAYVLPTVLEAMPLGRLCASSEAVSATAAAAVVSGPSVRTEQTSSNSAPRKARRIEREWRQRGAQVVEIRREAVAVPELLFSPADVGIPQAGVAETVARVIADSPRSAAARSVVRLLVVGGNANIPGFCARLHADTQAAIDESVLVLASEAAEEMSPPTTVAPDSAAVVGGMRLAEALADRDSRPTLLFPAAFAATGQATGFLGLLEFVRARSIEGGPSCSTSGQQRERLRLQALLKTLP